ncbi:MAG: TatD family hydrolase [Gemmatimonadales bacterium]
MATEARNVERFIEGFIDSHAHLADQAFDGDRSEVIERARNSGADAIVCIGSGSGAEDVLGAARASMVVAAAFPGFVWFTAGVHPHDAEGFESSRDMEGLRELASLGAVGLGECGLDYHYDNSPRREQRRAFAEQLSLANELDLPVVVHTRDAEEDTRSMVCEAGANGVVGVLHCYTGSHELAIAAVEVGWYVSFSGIVTFKTWKDDDLIRVVPADRLLAESDSPYLAPVPNRGRRNEPAWVAQTVARLALARGQERSAVGATVSENARRLFKLA